MMKLSEHLAGVSLVAIDLAPAATGLEEELRRFGPVGVRPLADWNGAKTFLLPLKTFTTRFVVFQLPRWSWVLSDMRGEASMVDALGISERTNCDAITGVFRDDSRFLHVIRGGETVREVGCYWDDNKWVFAEKGEPEGWEQTASYRKRRIRDRLTPQLVQKYLKAASGIDFPLNREAMSGLRGIGLERSLKDLQVPVLPVETEVDV